MELKKKKTKLKIDDAYFYAPYIPFYALKAEQIKQLLEDDRRHEIFEYVED